MIRPEVLRVYLGDSMPLASLLSTVADRLRVVLSARPDLNGLLIDPNACDLRFEGGAVYAVYYLPLQVQRALFDGSGRVVRGNSATLDQEVSAIMIDDAVKASAEFHAEVVHICAESNDPHSELIRLEHAFGISAHASLKTLRRPGEAITASTPMGTHEFARPASRKQYLHHQPLLATAKVLRWPDAKNGIALTILTVGGTHECSSELSVIRELRGYYDTSHPRIRIAAAIASAENLPLEIDGRVNISVVTRRPTSLEIVEVRNYGTLLAAAGSTERWPVFGPASGAQESLWHEPDKRLG